jgi:DNA-binding transcriptional LysR family regulator
VEVKGPVAADSAHMLLRLAIEGLGVIRFGDNVIARAVREGLLDPILQDFQEPDSFPLWAMLPPGQQRAPKVKVFVDFLIERFAAAPWRIKREVGVS